MRFETDLRDFWFHPEKEVRFLARIHQNHSGDSFVTIINRLLVQDEFELDRSVRTDQGAYCLYDGERLTASYSFHGEDGSRVAETLDYDSAGRPAGITIIAGDECHYEITYDKAGHVSKVAWRNESNDDEKKVTGTVTYSYDPTGKVSAVSAEFSRGRVFHLTYFLWLMLSD